jgi:hypothetical protein
MLSACQKVDGNCFVGQKRTAGGGIHTTRAHNNVTSVMKTLKKTAGHSEQKVWNFDI